VLHGKLDGVAYGIPDRPFGRPPEQVNPGDVDDALVRADPPRSATHPQENGTDPTVSNAVRTAHAIVIGNGFGPLTEPAN
jgi:hypothetical protein